MSSYSTLANQAQKTALVCYFGLIVLFAATTLIWVPAGKSPNIVICLIQTLPLLIFVSGLWRGFVRTYSWLCFVILIYFCITVTSLFIQSGRLVVWLELVLVVGLFIASVLFIRWKSRSFHEQAQ